MEIRKLGPGAGFGWLKEGVNLGRNNPRAIFGGAALMLLLVLLPALCFGMAIGISGAAKVGVAGMVSMMVVLAVVMILLVSALMVGFLRLIDTVENGQPAGARDVLAGFRDFGTTLRAIGFVLLLALVQNLLLALVIALLAPEFGSWYLQTLQASMHGAAQTPPAALPSGFALAMSVIWVLGLFFYAVQALGLGQIVLRDRGVFGALGDGVIGAAKNLLPLLVMLLTLVLAGIVAAIAIMLLVMLVAFLAKLVGAWLGIAIAIPLYIAFLVALYVVMFGVMYALWRGILGDNATQATAMAPGIEA